ncbi:MAG: DUF86 domain-containing protein [Candidatus Omnitrophica bacterium]|nr:DUF86 domain-containing protein [Candidatus Omnitrophota bacterium]
MLDKERILGKIDELDAYLKELNQIIPKNFEEYQKIEKKRSCERLIQLCIECVIDICKLFVAGLRLGLPSEENDLLKKIKKQGIISSKMYSTLREMRGFRNILIHEYVTIDDKIVFETLNAKLEDFQKFKEEILTALKKLK